MIKTRVMGIDPGWTNVGFGIVDFVDGRYKIITSGTITTDNTKTDGERLSHIYDSLQYVIDLHHPTQACQEDLFFSRNVTSALNVASAKGVIALCFQKNGIPLFNYKPNQIKKAITGDAKADKDTMERCIKFLLSIKTTIKTDHEADALSCALTHLHYCGM